MMMYVTWLFLLYFGYFTVGFSRQLFFRSFHSFPRPVKNNFFVMQPSSTKLYANNPFGDVSCLVHVL
jgi:hypothetical protein